jgi:hypothetical protein
MELHVENDVTTGLTNRGLNGDGTGYRFISCAFFLPPLSYVRVLELIHPFSCRVVAAVDAVGWDGGGLGLA